MGDSSFKCFDYENALSITGGDAELLCEVAALFLEDSRRLVDEIRSRLDSGDAEGVMRAAHSLKGSASNFYAASVVEKAMSVENAGRERRLDSADILLERLEDELESLCLELRSMTGER